MNALPRRFVAFVLAAAALVQVGYVLFAGLTDQLDIDDAFMYFTFARRLATEGRATVDGMHLTNGVQPLWALMLTVEAWLLPHSIVAVPLRLMVAFKLLACAANLLTGYLLYRLGSSIAGRTAGVVALLVWTLSPYIFRRDLVGFESAVYAGALALSVLAYRRWQGAQSGVNALWLGLALGATTLGRLNAVFLVPIVALAVASLAPRQAVRHLTLVGCGVCLLVVPYLMVNLDLMGHLMPISGAAKRALEVKFIDGRFGTMWSPAYALFSLGIARHNVVSLAVWLTKAFGSIVLMGTYVVVFRWRVVAGIGALGVSAVVATRPSAVKSAVAETATLNVDPRGLGVLGAYVVADLVISAFLFPQFSSAYWWFVDAMLFGVLAVACASGMLLTQVALARRPAFLVGLSVLAVLNASVWAIDRVNLTRRSDAPRSELVARYDAVLWGNDHLPGDAVVGTKNPGVDGFFSTHQTVDLTGLVNDFDFLEYLRTDRLDEVHARQAHWLRHWSDGHVRSSHRSPSRGLRYGLSDPAAGTDRRLRSGRGSPMTQPRTVDEP